MIPPDLVEGLDVTRVVAVGGGDISEAFRLDTPAGPMFVKTHPAPLPGLFEREAAGLRALRATGAIAVPEVVRQRASGLVLEWIEVGGRTARSEADLGRRLAAAHATHGPHFGGLDGASGGYLGSQPVDVTPTDDWPTFFVERRLRPLTARAVELGRIDPRAMELVDRAAAVAARRCGPPEPPCLLHGDLWAGNRLVDVDGRNWLIDPAAYWGHREVDLAMMALFGGFGDEAYAAYDEAAPLASGWRDRVSWYQLPPLLVHAILFGGSYGRLAMAALVRS
ncbi:MAG: fructosamine kinase family protein [Ilumatobacteraceae bacterium]